MSARVLNPVMFSEFYKMRSPVHSHIPSGAALAKIKRDLFGPVDKEDSKRFVETELTKHQLAACERWGFNFVHGYPLADHKQYIWERVPPTNAIPQMYTLTRAAHVREVITDHLAHYNDLLLDERAERSNRTEVMDTSSEDESTVKKRHAQEVIVAATAAAVAAKEVHSTLQRTHQQPQRCSPREKRQPRITDYLKKRKHLAPTPKKISPVKRAHQQNTSSSTSSNRKIIKFNL